MFDFLLATDETTYLKTDYEGSEELYTGETVDPGDEQRGVLLFQIPERVDSYGIRVNIAPDISLDWRV